MPCCGLPTSTVLPSRAQQQLDGRSRPSAVHQSEVVPPTALTRAPLLRILRWACACATQLGHLARRLG